MYTKKERLLIDREIEKLERFFGGVVGLKGEPQAVFVVDAKRERTAINECRIFDVPVVALIDTNSDPSDILKLVPGNDDAAKQEGKILTVVADCIEAGYKEFEKAKAVEKAKKSGLPATQITTTGSEAERVTDEAAKEEVVKEVDQEKAKKPASVTKKAPTAKIAKETVKKVKKEKK